MEIEDMSITMMQSLVDAALAETTQVDAALEETNMVDAKLEEAPIQNKTTYQSLVDSGLLAHYFRNSQDAANAKQATVRVARILEHTFKSKYSIVLKPEEVLNWFPLLIEKNYLLVDEFCTYLHEFPISNKPGTIVNYLDALAPAVSWLTYNRLNNDGDIIRTLTENQLGG